MAWAKFKVKKGISVKGEKDSTTAELVPVGIIIPWVNSGSIPDGWLLCNGQSITSANYPALVSLLGGGASQNVPNLTGCVVIGSGQGVGAGSSGNGLISGSNLVNRTTGLVPGSSTSHPSIDYTHDHSLSSHSHPMAHTHVYPHSHSYQHFHHYDHGHPTGGQTTQGAHNHFGLFSAQYGPGTGTALRAAGPTQLTGGASNGSHFHPIGSAPISVDPGGSPFATSVTTPSFAASPVNTSSTGQTPGGSPTTTATVGSSTTFLVSQPVIAMCYIIKY